MKVSEPDKTKNTIDHLTELESEKTIKWSSSQNCSVIMKINVQIITITSKDTHKNPT